MLPLALLATTSAVLGGCGPECRETLSAPVELGRVVNGRYEPVQNGGWMRLNFGPQGGVDTTVGVRADVTGLRNPRLYIRIEDAASGRLLGESRNPNAGDTIGGVFSADVFIEFTTYVNAANARVTAEIRGDEGRCATGEVAVEISRNPPGSVLTDAGRD